MRKWNLTTKKLPKDSTKVRDVASGPRGNFWTFSQFFCSLNFDQKAQNRVIMSIHIVIWQIWGFEEIKVDHQQITARLLLFIMVVNEADAWSFLSAFASSTSFIGREENLPEYKLLEKHDDFSFFFINSLPMERTIYSPTLRSLISVWSLLIVLVGHLDQN